MSDKVALQVRLPKELHESLKAKATQQGRPLNTMIVEQLERQTYDERLTSLEQEVHDLRSRFVRTAAPLTVPLSGLSYTMAQ